MQYSRLDSSAKTVSKYVFDFETAITESVLYKYPDFKTRTVLCISVQSGCPVGCTFCGTGKHFVRNLTSSEIVTQVTEVFKDQGVEDINDNCEKLQIMFMSMGEPMLNWDNVSEAITKLSYTYPNADLLISTVGIKDEAVMAGIINFSLWHPKVGLQFSIHKINDFERNILIPYKNTASIRELRDWGIQWSVKTGRKVYLNFCIEDGSNLAKYVTPAPVQDLSYIDAIREAEKIMDVFPSSFFNLTFSVVCNPDESMATAYNNNLEMLERLKSKFAEYGYGTRTFNPDGQDDIGGGCGELHHFQRWINGLPPKEL